eukprot:TRINITY_DN20054_c0_g1_i4.p1 TRINITY_DN20054_c0_g1~~TRINITY_DN20054_c0_g1_i4.p1  ORF type:complete len:408 (+),score=89.30 TRINITY_DN20054_c0_g1_i4:100-1323(+)
MDQGDTMQTIVISDDEDRDMDMDRDREDGGAENADSSDSDDDIEKVRRLSTALTREMDADWRPWKTDRDIQREKDKEDMLLRATSGVIDGKFVICHVHGKQRLVSIMKRVPGAVEKYECPSDSQCHVRPEGTPAGGDKRYYGSMRDVVAKRRTWKKVCWECGIGEHERYDCPNKLDPVTANPTQYNKGNRNDFAMSWRPERHYIIPNEMTESYCVICSKRGHVNCCSTIVEGPLSCATCTGPSHTLDECTVTQTNYHGRQSYDRSDRRGSKGGRYDYQRMERRMDDRSDGYQSSPYGATPGRGRGGKGYPNRPPYSVDLPSPMMASPASVVCPPDMQSGMNRAGGAITPRSRFDDRGPPSRGGQPYSQGDRGPYSDRATPSRYEYEPPQYEPPVFSPYPAGRNTGRW